MNLTAPKNWRTVKLGDISNFISRGITPVYTESDGVTILNQKCIRDWKVSFGDSRKTSKISSEKLLKDGDILICSTGIGTLGRVAQIFDFEGPLTVDSHISIVRPDMNKIDQKFLGYFLKKSEKTIEAMAEGSTGQTELSRIKLRDFDFEIPESFEEQKEIASILGSLDDKIELLLRENKTLESIAQTLFKEWFVNFKFPGYKEIKIVDGIPEGWRVGKLGEFINVRGGLSYDGNLISKKGTPMLTMGFVSGNKRFEWSGLKFYTGKYKDQNRVEVGSLVIATRDVTQDRILIGSPALVPKILGSSDIIVATNLYIAENINYLSNKFLYWLMRTPEYRERIVGACKGTTIVMITKDSIFDYEFVVPPNKITEKFDQINDHIFNKLELIDIEIQTLSRLRNDLLNKIFSN